jgi:hypothetical protein
MNPCASCGAELSPAMNLCPHHHAPQAGWAATNRIMCDFVHRGIVIRRVPVAEREAETRGCLQEVA